MTKKKKEFKSFTCMTGHHSVADVFQLHYVKVL